MSNKRLDLVVLVLCITAFCVAMGLHESLNVWLGTGVAATLSLLLLRRLSSPPGIRAGELSALNVATGVAVGLAMAVTTWLLYPISVDLVPGVSTEVPKLYSVLRQPPGPLLAFPVIVLVITAEEWVWRGLAIDVIGRTASPAASVVLASLTYVLPQVAFRSPLLVVVALLCGLVWGALRVWTKGLTAPLIAHVLWNVLVFVLFPVE